MENQEQIVNSQKTVNLEELPEVTLKQLGYDSFMRREYLIAELDNSNKLIQMINQELVRRSQENTNNEERDRE